MVNERWTKRTSFSRRARWLGAAALAGALGLCGALPGTGPARARAAATQPAATTRPAARITAQDLAQLDNDAWKVREAATQRLLALDLTPQAVAAAYARARSPEQRQRLELIAEHQFLRTYIAAHFSSDTSAALGVRQQMVLPNEDNGLKHPAVRVEATLPGFPATGRLQTGDLILALDGKPFPDAGQDPATVLRQQVLGLRPGDLLHLTVQRDGRTLQVAVPLAPASALGALLDPVSGELLPDIAQRWRDFRQAMERSAPPARRP